MRYHAFNPSGCVMILMVNLNVKSTELVCRHTLCSFSRSNDTISQYSGKRTEKKIETRVVHTEPPCTVTEHFIERLQTPISCSALMPLSRNAGSLFPEGDRLVASRLWLRLPRACYLPRSQCCWKKLSFVESRERTCRGASSANSNCQGRISASIRSALIEC